ncbi:hypothetical protein R1flu_013184 [Riccia fluitans]|uniref:Disease resistance R13L4/SHOC-2-like LRR domain-containing protein n=1 Tax=Riccia fluitans TaxID=41844 RepID=A0ABD1XIH5_9MARC
MRQVWPKLTAIQYMTLTVDVTNCCNQCRNQTVALPRTLLLLCLSLPTLRDISVVTGRNSVDHMSGTLSLATCASLVRLELWNCKNVGDLSKLQQLRILEIEQCSVAENWTTSLGELKSLERLELARIEEPFELPISFGRLTELQYFRISGCKVTSIPASFRKLTSLQVLEVERIIGRQVIPIRRFRRLRSLKMTCWAIADLADVFRELIALEEFHCEGISELPATLENLTLLKKLWVKCHVKVLPDSLGNLTNLEVENCPIQSLPETLGQLSSLRRLKVSFCRNLKTLPDSIGDLSSLESLGLSGSALHSLPDTIKNLSQLETLHICYCKNLKTVPDWIGDLTSLRHFTFSYIS